MENTMSTDAAAPKPIMTARNVDVFYGFNTIVTQ